MNNKLNDLQKFLKERGLNKQASFLQKLKEEAYEFSEEYIDPYLDDAKEYIDPYLDKAKEYVDPYLDKAKEYIDPYLDDAKEYIKDVVKKEESPQVGYIKNEHYDAKNHKDDSKYKSWSSADNMKYKYRSNFAKVYGSNNYRSAKPIAKKEFFEYLKDKYNINTIINLIGGVAPNRKEQKAVTDAGLNYIHIPMFDKPPSESDWNVFNGAMRFGNALVHCHHGADRTGAMIARWEIENGEKSTDEAYASALRYGFKPKDFRYKGSKIDPNKHLREYIFDSKQKVSSKESYDEQPSFFDEALSYGKEKIREYIDEDKEDLFVNPGDYTDETGLTPINPRVIYNYLRQNIGMKENQALGIISNMYRESGFRPGVKGDGGHSWGLFQMNGSRRRNMVADVPDWKTNWRGQINHAVYTDPSSDLYVMRKYMQKDFESPGHAGHWFAVHYERPAAVNRKNPSWYNRRIKNEGFIV